MGLVEQLDSFDSSVRLAALKEAKATEEAGAPAEPTQVNMHCHTFFSYNGYGASPSRLAYEAWKRGWEAVGTCDFDVLDAKDEFLTACDLLGVRGTVNLETRVFVKEYADHEINSPGEPGVYYFMGAGFVNEPSTQFAVDQLAKMRSGAEKRNRDMLAEINDYLGGFRLDYDEDILPLAPKGNVTERHMCTAFYNKSRETFGDGEWVELWSDMLGVDIEKIADILDDPMAFSDVCRSKLMKKGGPGYAQPGPDTFPSLDDVTKMILDCQAIPMATWLDGSSSGESNIKELLEFQIEKGIVALNIVPDRNWNYKDVTVAAEKAAKLHECVAAAKALDMPINVGTELNKFGQPWIDNFAAMAMKPVAADFVAGAHVMVGHTRLLRFADFSYVGEKAAASYPERASRNAFFQKVGALAAPNAELLQKLQAGDAESNFALLADAAAKGTW